MTKQWIPALFWVSTLFLPLFSQEPGPDLVKPVHLWPELTIPRPLALVIPEDDSGRRFLVSQRGKIHILPEDNNSKEAPIFLDISQRSLAAKDGDFEEGLLGLAFHPEFAKNGLFYLQYTRQNPKRSVVAEWKVAADNPNLADPATERILLEVPQPFWNHNSGNLLFGPDGMLYLSFGDGGKRDDPFRLAQNPFVLNGKILRIDVNGRSWHDAYDIPADNPFAGKDGVRPEIWALGLRNPWGLSFDEAGQLWCADVGQDLWEEINIIIKGGNYGWNYREGARPFPLRTDPPAEKMEFLDPIHEYGRGDGLSITGGFVYQGKAHPGLKGAYIYGDWATGRLWALQLEKGTNKVEKNTLLYLSPAKEAGASATKTALKPTAIVPDQDGEILIIDWNGGIFKLMPL